MHLISLSVRRLVLSCFYVFVIILCGCSKNDSKSGDFTITLVDSFHIPIDIDDFVANNQQIYFSSLNGLYTFDAQNKNLSRIRKGAFQGIALEVMFGKKLISTLNTQLGYQKFFSLSGKNYSGDYLNPVLGKNPKFMIYKNERIGSHFLFGWGSKKKLRQWKLFKNANGKIEKLRIRDYFFKNKILEVAQYDSDDVFVLCQGSQIWRLNPNRVDQPIQLVSIQKQKQIVSFDDLCIIKDKKEPYIFLLDDLGNIWCSREMADNRLAVEIFWKNDKIEGSMLKDFQVLDGQQFLLLTKTKENNAKFLYLKEEGVTDNFFPRSQ